MIQVVINGAAGRMGRRLINLVRNEEDMTLVAALEHEGCDALGADAGEIAGCGSLGVKITAEWLGPADVLIDFTSPAGTLARLDEAIEKKAALMIGTTGCTASEEARIAKAAEKVPVLHPPNTSVGVNLLFDLVGQVAAALGDDYDIEIVEAHHRFKKDAPSGTALRLAENICKATGREIAKDVVHGRQGITEPRTQKEIGMHAVRAGDIVGEHTVTFCALGERIELTHRAHTRDTFARGAIRAARFLVGKEPGMYTMADVLGGADNR